MKVQDKGLLEVQRALLFYKEGVDPNFIELSEKAVFPHLINAAPSTGRKSRVTGILLGQAAPSYIKRGRSIRYRLSTILKWISNPEIFTNSTHAFNDRKDEDN